ncbi:MAG: hypothetical protein IPK10_00550 [Bacteroidetes bacterium]|nr:hypothetical protein [Bacteroidota bacterium]
MSNGLNQAGYAEYIFVHKLNSAGATLWKDSISTGTPNNRHAATWVGIDSNDNIFIVGYQYTLSLQNEFPNALKYLNITLRGGTSKQNYYRNL